MRPRSKKTFGAAAFITSVLVMGIAGAVEARGQEAESIIFVASVFDIQSRGPVIAAFVAAVEQDLITTTDRNGSFRLEGLAPGTHTIRVWRLGYVQTEFSVSLGEKTVSVLDAPIMLAPDPVRMAEVVVEGSSNTVLAGPVAEFYRRRREARGVFLARADFEESGADRFDQLLRTVPGVDVHQVGDMRYAVRMSSARLNGCSPQFWVDGIRVEERWAMALQPEGIEGIEVYRRLSEVPAEFAGRGSCGVIVVWTRR